MACGKIPGTHLFRNHLGEDLCYPHYNQTGPAPLHTEGCVKCEAIRAKAIAEGKPLKSVRTAEMGRMASLRLATRGRTHHLPPSREFEEHMGEIREARRKYNESHPAPKNWTGG